MKERKANRYTVRYSFNDADETLPLDDVTKRLLGQFIAMANSDDPGLRAKGIAKLQEISDAAVEGQLNALDASARNSSNASRPRPKKEPTLKDRIESAMKPYKRSGLTFKQFMQAWEASAINELELRTTENPAIYEICDYYTDEVVSRSYSTLQGNDWKRCFKKN